MKHYGWSLGELWALPIDYFVAAIDLINEEAERMKRGPDD